MYEWSDEHKMIRDAVRDFVEKEVRPRREELEFGDTPPYDVIRKLYTTFGMGEMARASFAKRIEKERQSEQRASATRARARAQGSCSCRSSSCAVVRPAW